MPPLPAPETSVDACRPTLGARAALHLDSTFRRILRDERASARVCHLLTGAAHPLGNVAIVNVPDDAGATRLALEPLAAGKFPAAVLFPAGVGERARALVIAAGFTDAGDMPAMAVDIARLPGAPVPAGMEWSRVLADERSAAWEESFAVGYGLPRPVARCFAPAAFGAAAAPDADVQCFALSRNGRMVATSMLALSDGLAGIYCVAVLPEERRLGLGAFVTAEALRAAARLGYKVGILQSSAEGHSVYRKLGFADVGQVRMFVRLPA